MKIRVFYSEGVILCLNERWFMPTLINCEACNKEISKEAATCPNCGHPNNAKAAIINPQKKKRGLLKTLFIVIFVLWVIGTIMGKSKEDKSNVKVNSTANQETVVPAPTPKTEAEMKLEKLNNKLALKFGKKPEQSGWDGSYREVKRYLEAAANDPDSIKIETCTNVSYDEKTGWLVGCDYRGKNAFGGVVRNSNWFVIKNGGVFKMLPANAYKQK